MDEEYSYEHLLLGQSVPIRVLRTKTRGLKVGAQIPDRRTGRLEFKNTYLSRIEQSPEVEEISESEFDELCRRIFAGSREQD